MFPYQTIQIYTVCLACQLTSHVISRKYKIIKYRQVQKDGRTIKGDFTVAHWYHACLRSQNLGFESRHLANIHSWAVGTGHLSAKTAKSTKSTKSAKFFIQQKIANFFCPTLQN